MMPITVMALRLVQPGPSEFTTNHGSLGVIEFFHTKAHHTLEQDVHGHVHRALQKNPELARSTCWELE